MYYLFLTFYYFSLFFMNFLFDSTRFFHSLCLYFFHPPEPREVRAAEQRKVAADKDRLVNGSKGFDF